ncbi:DUF1963 domain-containing protein [Streptomyces sp. NPDC023723]|uniref:DUF1963 domain-containing protein n=1 Tax=Streptomyces sp. NPDC023723 TaxID=3154323 RepID=UPI003402903A
MKPEMVDRLDRFRQQARARGVPAAEVERWLTAARPCATLTPHGDGPVVGRFGGPAPLPAGHPALPPRTYLIASLDLAALPGDATTLPLPSGGRLLLFARSYDEGMDAGGEAVYVPAGTPVAERDLEPGHSPDDPWALLDRPGPPGHEVLRLTHDVSLPDNESLYDRAEHPHARQLRDAWRDIRREDARSGPRFQLDGYAQDPYGETDMVTGSAWMAAEKSGEPPRVEDWALLVQWYGGHYVGGDVYWTVNRQDAARRRFGEVMVLGFFEGPV